MSKLSDGPTSTQAHTLPALLRELHIDHIPVEKQRLVLREWLRDHTPDRSLRISLRSNGFGLLLDEQFGRITRHTAGHG